MAFQGPARLHGFVRTSGGKHLVGATGEDPYISFDDTLRSRHSSATAEDPRDKVSELKGKPSVKRQLRRQVTWEDQSLPEMDEVDIDTFLNNQREQQQLELSQGFQGLAGADRRLESQKANGFVSQHSERQEKSQAFIMADPPAASAERSRRGSEPRELSGQRAERWSDANGYGEGNDWEEDMEPSVQSGDLLDSGFAPAAFNGRASQSVQEQLQQAHVAERVRPSVLTNPRNNLLRAGNLSRGGRDRIESRVAPREAGGSQVQLEPHHQSGSTTEYSTHSRRSLALLRSQIQEDAAADPPQLQAYSQCQDQASDMDYVEDGQLHVQSGGALVEEDDFSTVELPRRWADAPTEDMWNPVEQSLQSGHRGGFLAQDVDAFEDLAGRRHPENPIAQEAAAARRRFQSFNPAEARTPQGIQQYLRRDRARNSRSEGLPGRARQTNGFDGQPTAADMAPVERAPPRPFDPAEARTPKDIRLPPSRPLAPSSRQSRSAGLLGSRSQRRPMSRGQELSHLFGGESSLSSGRAACRFTQRGHVEYVGLPRGPVGHDAAKMLSCRPLEGSALGEMRAVTNAAETFRGNISHGQNTDLKRHLASLPGLLRRLGKAFVGHVQGLFASQRPEVWTFDGVPCQILLAQQLIQTLDLILPSSLSPLAAMAAAPGLVPVAAASTELAAALAGFLEPSSVLETCLDIIAGEGRRIFESAEHFSAELQIHASLLLRLLLEWDCPQSSQHPGRVLLEKGGADALLDKIVELNDYSAGRGQELLEVAAELALLQDSLCLALGPPAQGSLRQAAGDGQMLRMQIAKHGVRMDPLGVQRMSEVALSVLESSADATWQFAAKQLEKVNLEQRSESEANFNAFDFVLAADAVTASSFALLGVLIGLDSNAVLDDREHLHVLGGTIVDVLDSQPLSPRMSQSLRLVISQPLLATGFGSHAELLELLRRESFPQRCIQAGRRCFQGGDIAGLLVMSTPSQDSSRLAKSHTDQAEEAAAVNLRKRLALSAIMKDVEAMLFEVNRIDGAGTRRGGAMSMQEDHVLQRQVEGLRSAYHDCLSHAA